MLREMGWDCFALAYSLLEVAKSYAGKLFLVV